ncbi:MAG: KpsF/GutQ family sugar-phosphate isomerase [Pseudomonadota bacterium]
MSLTSIQRKEKNTESLFADPAQWLSMGKQILAQEQNALAALETRLDQSFVRACRLILGCTTRIVLSGIGKSGHIARKIAATMASTGTPAFFLHPSEANHGDLGMLTPGDVLILCSYSGATPELLTLVPRIQRLGIPIILLTGHTKTLLAAAAEVVLDVSVAEEAGHLGLAPSSSTTCALAMGDALALSVSQMKGFTEEDFAACHPGGTLGKRLILLARDVMRQGDALPRVLPECLIKDAMVEMSRAAMGMTTVMSTTGDLLGVFTDGDLRRAISKDTAAMNSAIIGFMTKSFKTIQPNTKLTEALTLMKQYKITVLLVISESGTLAGALHLHDILRTGLAL